MPWADPVPARFLFWRLWGSYLPNDADDGDPVRLNNDPQPLRRSRRHRAVEWSGANPAAEILSSEPDLQVFQRHPMLRHKFKVVAHQGSIETPGLPNWTP